MEDDDHEEGGVVMGSITLGGDWPQNVRDDDAHMTSRRQLSFWPLAEFMICFDGGNPLHTKYRRDDVACVFPLRKIRALAGSPTPPPEGGGGGKAADEKRLKKRAR